MSVKIKICGVSGDDALDATLEGGADFFGLVFYRPSPRCVSLATARALIARARARAKAVALLVDPTPEEAKHIALETGADLIQLHGTESPELADQIKAATGLPVIKAVAVGSQADAAGADAFAGIADFVLYDAKTPRDGPADLPGGNGVAFDWHMLDDIKDKSHFMLSGGLTPDNVAAAISLTHAPMIDVSSGVERKRGEKDPELIRRFIAAARAAPQLG